MLDILMLLFSSFQTQILNVQTQMSYIMKENVQHSDLKFVKSTVLMK